MTAMKKKVVGLGEVLWDLLPESTCLGGAPANFAYITTLLGDQGMVASRVGEDPRGMEALRRLEDLGLDIKHVPCKTCSYPTDKTGTGLCDGCWEVEHRLAAYLRDGGRVAVSFVARALADAAEGR